MKNVLQMFLSVLLLFFAFKSKVARKACCYLQILWKIIGICQVPFTYDIFKGFMRTRGSVCE